MISIDKDIRHKLVQHSSSSIHYPVAYCWRNSHRITLFNNSKLVKEKKNAKQLTVVKDDNSKANFPMDRTLGIGEEGEEEGGNIPFRPILAGKVVLFLLTT